MKINIAHVAKLANLPISPQEEQKFASQLSNVLDYIARLNEIDTTNVEETSQITGLENITRKDEAGKCLSQKKLSLRQNLRIIIFLP